MRLIALTFLLPWLVLAADAAAQSPRPVAADPADAAAMITPAEVREHIAFLSDDALRGRDTPSPGLDSAAVYLTRSFRGLGLEPAGDDGGFIQRYPFPTVALDAGRARFELRGDGDGGGAAVRYGADYFAIAGVPDSIAGPLIFTGTGAGPLSEGESGALRGRVPIVHLPGTPGRSWQQEMARARRAAADAGATAVVFILDPAVDAGMVERLAAAVEEPQRRLGDVRELPAFFVRTDPARRLFRRAGRDLDALLEAAGADAPFDAVPLEGVRAELAAPVRVLEADSAPNVVAVLPGADPELRGEYVVFSAHMDHVGVGSPDAAGDSIYNGADDNATGTTALLELAESFASLPDDERPARSLVFLAVSGEEKGLLGSRWFTERPTIPLDDVVANLNMDMIGRNAADSVVVIGQEYSSLGPLVRDVAGSHPGLGLTVSEDLWPEQRFFFRSDHFNFARQEIPALFFFAGTHDDYHQPSDEAEKVDADKAARVMRLVFHTGYAIANADEPPRWTDEGLAEIRAMTR